MAGTGIMAGICTSPSPYPTEKSGISHTHTHTQSMRGFPVKTETSLGNTHGGGFICHLYLQQLCNQFVSYSNVIQMPTI